MRLRGRNEIWNSDIIDLSDERWISLLVDDLARTAHERGFDGVFLDTVDSDRARRSGGRHQPSQAPAGVFSGVDDSRQLWIRFGA